MTFSLDLGLRDHRRAAGHAPGRRHRGRDRRRHAAPAGRLLDGRHDEERASYAFRDPAGLRPLVARQDRRPLLRRQRVVRVRHHRRQAPARRRARASWSRSATTASARGRSSPARARRSASSSTSTSRGPTRAWAATSCRRSRGRMGEILAREAPAPGADLVIPVPDSGNAAARGFARASGLPQDDGLIKNRYVGRTFIQPGQELRKHGLRLKFNPLPEIVGGKSSSSSSTTRSCAATRRARSCRCCATRARARCTCASPPRRSATPATTASTCRRARR